MTLLCMYYAPCFVHVEHSVYHKPISVIINVLYILYIYIIYIIQTTSPHGANLSAERIRNSGVQFFACLVETFGVFLARHEET